MRSKILIAITTVMMSLGLNSIFAQSPMMGEIRMFAGDYAPRGWAFCDGQILSIAEHQTLFSIIGSTYGGDGVKTFALPDLRGRAPIHEGKGTSATATNHTLGEKGGEESLVLTTPNLPAHNHSVSVVEDKDKAANQMARPTGEKSFVVVNKNTSSTTTTTGNTGNAQPVKIMQPYLTINYIIAIEGIETARN